MTGSEVATAQTKLNEFGAGQAANGAPLAVDELFGPLTDAATRQFQTAHTCDEDGKIGPQTWTALLGYPVMTPEQRQTETDRGLLRNSAHQH